MPRAELERLIQSSLRFLGAEEASREDGVLGFRLAGDLAERLGREELLLTFSAATAAGREDVELVSAGSFLHDLILKLVRERGRAAAGWMPRDPAVVPAEVLERGVPRIRGRRLSRVRSGWGAVYLFSFRLGFYYDTPHERLYTVRVDPARQRVRHEVHPERLIERAAGAPPEGEAGEARVDPERAFRMAWGKVEEEVVRLTERHRRQAQDRLEEEIHTVESYYRELIEEEKRGREQKTTRRGRDDSDRRIELLKLEWDRRIAEEKKRLSPEVSVVLSCASCLRIPLERWRARPEPGGRESVLDYWVDLSSGDVWPARKKERRTRRAADRAG